MTAADYDDYDDDPAPIIADWPEVWRRLLERHVADHLGKCRECKPSRWPCSLRAIAEKAQRIALARQTGSPKRATDRP